MLRSLRRIGLTLLGFGGFALLAWLFWRPGLELTDGRHDRGTNAIWMAHGWLGADEWFTRNHREAQLELYRSPQSIQAQAELLRSKHITDVFPHLCPARNDGGIALIDDAQAERFLDAFAGFRVMPWVGGVLDVNAHIEDVRWRAAFVASVAELLRKHPRLSGVHVNIEPCPSGTAGYLALLTELRAVLPKGKLLSVAAYPPPSLLHPFPHVHWEESYFREVASRSDQVAVMLYDTALKQPKLFEHVVSQWTQEVLRWSGQTEVLLGVAAYDDAQSGWHDPRAENVTESLLGIHAGLESFDSLPAHYRGVAIYSAWEMTPEKWADYERGFVTK